MRFLFDSTSKPNLYRARNSLKAQRRTRRIWNGKKLQGGREQLRASSRYTKTHTSARDIMPRATSASPGEDAACTTRTGSALICSFITMVFSRLAGGARLPLSLLACNATPVGGGACSVRGELHGEATERGTRSEGATKHAVCCTSAKLRRACNIFNVSLFLSCPGAL